jgi:hypothetical protein
MRVLDLATLTCLVPISYGLLGLENWQCKDDCNKQRFRFVSRNDRRVVLVNKDCCLYCDSTSEYQRSYAANSTTFPFRDTSVLGPSMRSLYDVRTGADHYNSASGKIFKNRRSTGVVTLLTFDFSSLFQGKTCECHSYPGGSATVSGTGTFGIYTSLTPASKDTAPWPSGNSRDLYEGRTIAAKTVKVQILLDYVMARMFLICPWGVKLGMQLVGTGDTDDIE